MGMSANQARFLSLTSRQVDLEYRMQEICHRRLRLSSELEKVATKYNNALSDRALYASSPAYETLSLENLAQLGFKVIDSTNNLVEEAQFINPVTRTSEADAIAAGYVVIKNAEDLVNVLNADVTAGTTTGQTYILMGDIDFSELGTQADSIIDGTFNGTFDGNGYTIKNLDIDTNGVASTEVGMFDILGANGEIKDVNIQNANVSATGSDAVGILVGNANIGSTIDNVSITGTGSVEGNSFIGGMVGYNCGTLTNSFVSSYDITGNQSVGGIAGENIGTISGSYVENIDIDGVNHSGSLVGANVNGGTIQDSYAIDSTISATGDNSGGLVGLNWNNATVETSYATGIEITSTGNNSGGLIGQNTSDSIAQDVYATDITIDSSGNNNGGLVGSNFNNSLVDNAYTSNITLDVDSGINTGGLVGYNIGSTVQDAYATNNEINSTGMYTGGLVGAAVKYDDGSTIFNSLIQSAYVTDSTVTSTSDNVGGLVGYNADTMSNVYTDGNTISGVNQTGGLVGSSDTGSLVIGAYSTNNTVTGTGNEIGGLVGINKGDITQTYSSNAVTGILHVGGLVGTSEAGAISDSYTDGGTVLGVNLVGGFTGAATAGTTITDSYSINGSVEGDTNVGGFTGFLFGSIDDTYTNNDVMGINGVGGFIGSNWGDISDSYAGGTVYDKQTYDSVNLPNSTFGGFVGMNSDNDLINDYPASITNSYTESDLSLTYTTANVGGFAGWAQDTDTTFTNNFYDNNIPTDGVLGNESGDPGTWGTITDNTNAASTASYTPLSIAVNPTVTTTAPTSTYDLNKMSLDTDIEDGLRSGNYNLVKEADEFTQTSIQIGDTEYEMVDWRVVPEINDDLYRGNDVEAENEYDAAVEKINAQDKKLQLEQSQIEVEHKAILTQKDAVKAVITKNTETSFKTFS